MGMQMIDQQVLKFLFYANPIIQADDTVSLV